MAALTLTAPSVRGERASLTNVRNFPTCGARCTDGASGRDLPVGVSWRWAWNEFELSIRKSGRLPSPWHNAPQAANRTKEMTRIGEIRFTIAGPATRPLTLQRRNFVGGTVSQFGGSDRRHRCQVPVIYTSCTDIVCTPDANRKRSLCRGLGPEEDQRYAVLRVLSDNFSYRKYGRWIPANIRTSFLYFQGWPRWQLPCRQPLTRQGIYIVKPGRAGTTIAGQFSN
jgi:hypothetical protein